ncbi:MAG TPA: hypothetical protein PLF92_12165 [Arenimonas sp.]|nr:hypothetical protein [Arenimonas sp.]HOZ05321.1 hypothetical protein [Arenimonas sp.]HPO24034.1 hypothetical protein [Arenimonas sp.]HPW33655.1 hypothetical protein [Arenimonas sp.]
MGSAFWVRRFLLVFGIVFAAIVAAHLLRGHELVYSLKESVLWAMISTNIFITSRIYQSRRGVHCALCKDTPEMQSGS